MTMLKFAITKVTAYLIAALPITGVSFLLFQHAGRYGFAMAIAACMVLLHLFLASDRNVNWQKFAVMRLRHFSKIGKISL
jgi:hypothetical protein